MRKLRLVLSITFLIIMVMLGIGSVVLFASRDKNKKIITTNFAIYDMCRELMGDDEDILLLGGGVDMHGYQPTAHDIIKVANCDVFIHIGGESDSWVDEIIKSSKNNDILKISLLDKVELICSDHDHEHAEEHHHHEFDEHIWLSIDNMITLSDSVYESLVTKYPEKEEDIFVNKNKYVSKLMSLKKEYADAFSDSSAKVVIADRFPFAYLFNDYNIEYYSLFKGCSAESEASPETIANFISIINNLQAKYIYNLENTSTNNVRKIINNSDCIDVEILTLNSMQTINKDEITVRTYVDIMKDNLENLRKAI